MKRSELGKICLFVNIGLWIGVGLILLNNFVFQSESAIMGAIHELVAGATLLAAPTILITSTFAFYKDEFEIKSYSFISVLLSIGLVTLFVISFFF